MNPMEYVNSIDFCGQIPLFFFKIGATLALARNFAVFESFKKFFSCLDDFCRG